MKYAEFKLSSNLDMTFHCREWLPEGKSHAGIFLVHGLSDHGGRFDTMARFFSSKGYTFFAADMRGNGLSLGKRGHFESLEQIFQDLDFLIKKAAERSPGIPWMLYGQSMGGNLVTRYSLSNPARISAVIASSPWLRLTHPPAAMIQYIGKFISRYLPSLQLSNGINPSDLCHDDQVNEAYRNDPLIHGKITVGTYQIISQSGEWSISNASKLAIPLLLMHGDADPITSFHASTQFVSKAGSSCSFKRWEGMYHELHNEPEKLAILNFVEEWINSIQIHA